MAAGREDRNATHNGPGWGFERGHSGMAAEDPLGMGIGYSKDTSGEEINTGGGENNTLAPGGRTHNGQKCHCWRPRVETSARSNLKVSRGAQVRGMRGA